MATQPILLNEVERIIGHSAAAEPRDRPSQSGALAAAVVLIVGAAAARAGSVATAATESVTTWTPAECVRLASLRAAVATPETRRASVDSVRAELRRVPPVAWVEGYWATPLGLSGLATKTGREVSAGTDGAGGAGGEKLPLLGLAFVPGSLRAATALPFVGDIARPWASEAARPGVFLVPVRDRDEALFEYLPPPLVTGERECAFFCGEPASWDFDGDGVANASDPDDDGDGVADREDTFPYWPALSACECDGRTYVGVTGKFSAQVSAAVLAAFAVLERGPQPLRLGAVGDEASGVWMVLPDEATCPSPQPPCPDPEDEGVRYVSRDPADCARLRFRCPPGGVPFSDACGCGCAASEPSAVGCSP